MYIEGFEQWFKVNKNVSAPISEWNRAVTEISSRVMRQNIELMGENFSRLSDQFKRFSSVRRPEELIALQKDCLNENVSASINGLQKMVQTTIDNLEDFTRLCSACAEHQVTTMNKVVDRGKEHYEKEKEKVKEKEHAR